MTVTAYDTTLPLLPLPELVDAEGEIAATVPATSLEIAPIVTVAGWFRLILLMSVSTTSAVTSYVPASTTIASPDGASAPAVMLIADTMPSIGATSVAAASWASMSRCWVSAWASWDWAW